jgi:hypothetical protein
MTSPSVLSFDELLAALAGDDPAGGPVPFALREKLETARKEIDPSDFADDDPARPAEAVRADWAGILRLTRDALRATSKDLLLAARLRQPCYRVEKSTPGQRSVTPRAIIYQRQPPQGLGNARDPPARRPVQPGRPAAPRSARTNPDPAGGKSSFPWQVAARFRHEYNRPAGARIRTPAGPGVAAAV